MSRIIFLMTTIVALPFITRGDELADKRAAYTDAGKAERNRQLGYHKRQVDTARAEILQEKRSKGRMADASYVRIRTITIAYHDKEIKSLEASPFATPRLSVVSLKSGQAGILYMPAGIDTDYVFHLVKYGRVYQVVSKDNVVIQCLDEPKPLLWMRIDTTDMVDDQIYNFRGPYEVLGTRTHGGSTMFELAPFDPGPLP